MRRVGVEFRRSYQRRIDSGFVDKYLSGTNILDIGYRGCDPETVPITENAVGIGLDYPGYDGVHLPFADQSQDAVFASHILEHVPKPEGVLAEWYRVLKHDGYMCIFVPHKYLYERRPDLPSWWNGDHKRFYTPTSLMAEVERSLPVNGFRIRHMADNDFNFDYRRNPIQPPSGCYEIELVVQKIDRPTYSEYLEPSHELKQVIAALDIFCIELVKGLADNVGGLPPFLPQRLLYVTSWRKLCERFATSGQLDEGKLREAVKRLLVLVDVDVEWYLRRYPPLANHPNPVLHWQNHGYFEGRPPRNYWPVTIP